MLTFSTPRCQRHVLDECLARRCFVVLLFLFASLPVQRIGQVVLRIHIGDANVNIAAFGKLALATFCVHPRCRLTPALAFIWE